MSYRLPMSFVYFYDTYAISTKMNSLKNNVINSLQKNSAQSKDRRAENVIPSHNESVNFLEVHIHWSVDSWDCSVECPKNRTRSFRSQMVNKQGRI